MNPLLPGANAPGFDAPLAVLEACHARIARLCGTLDALVAHLPAHGADADGQKAAAAILRYFDSAGVNHHDDEERNLFPLLERALPGETCDLVETLTLEHEEQGLLWRRLRAQLAAIVRGEVAGFDPELAARFARLNREHLRFENECVLPLAARALSPADLERLGRAMAARRGVAYPA